MYIHLHAYRHIHTYIHILASSTHQLIYEWTHTCITICMDLYVLYLCAIWMHILFICKEHIDLLYRWMDGLCYGWVLAVMHKIWMKLFLCSRSFGGRLKLEPAPLRTHQKSEITQNTAEHTT
ncbi:hypothetical protein KP509_27G060100 [Ceratopteris richardii]|uniref:Uncharacterized protein n=1 Tax=Ceratopteris richardii TaxID=49495 RepID=A0A8T2RI89_CERRI|nr:hypothetical protein KP509_27G060100 [Ceratopteris richardii]